MRKFKYITFTLSLFLFVGCDLFTMDKLNEQGVNFFRVNLPKFDASYDIELIDYHNPEKTYTKPIILSYNTIQIGGIANPDELFVSVTGKITKNKQISNGFTQLFLNPNIKISDNKPIEATLVGKSADGTAVILPYYIKQTSPGAHQIKLYVVNVDKLPSGSPTTTPPTINGATHLLSLPQILLNNGYILDELYRADQNQISLNSTSQEISHKLGDIATVSDFNLLSTSLSTQPKEIALLTHAMEGELTFAKLTLNLTANIKANTTINYEITNNNKKVASGKINRPVSTEQTTYTIDQIPYDKANRTLTIILKPEAPFIIGNSTINAIVAGSGETSIDVKLQADTQGLTLYQATMVGVCPSNTITKYYLSQQFQYSETPATSGAIREWKHAYLNEGVASLLLKKNTSYSFRVIFENEIKQYDITTDPTKISTVLEKNLNINSFSITEEANDNYSIQLEYWTTRLCN